MHRQTNKQNEHHLNGHFPGEPNLASCLADFPSPFISRRCILCGLRLADHLTSCRRAAATICLRPLQVNNIFVFIRRRVSPVPACWIFKTSATSWPLTFWPWKCDVGYLCADFSPTRPFGRKIISQTSLAAGQPAPCVSNSVTLA